MENKEAKMYYYPYCGYRLGWCKSNEPCKSDKVCGKYCKYFMPCHPITKLQPDMMPNDTEKWLRELVNGDK